MIKVDIFWFWCTFVLVPFNLKYQNSLNYFFLIRGDKDTTSTLRRVGWVVGWGGGVVGLR